VVGQVFDYAGLRVGWIAIRLGCGWFGRLLRLFALRLRCC